MTEGLRLAALKLHGVGAADRDWVLDRLGRRERRQLVALLRDLKRAGIVPAYANAVQQEVATPSEPRRAEPLAAGVPDALAQADAAAVARVLRAEPEWVRSAIFAVHPWKWRRAVLQRLGGSEGDAPARTSPVLSGPELRPAFTAALARALARRIEAEASFDGLRTGSPFERVMDNLDPLERAPRSRIWERLRLWIR